MFDLSAIELKAVRSFLGLTVAEASADCGVTKRTFQYWESGERNIPADAKESFIHYASVYGNICILMQKDIDAWNDARPIPQVDDAEVYARSIKQRGKLTVPYFRTLERFTEVTGNPHIFSMRVYNSVVAHYFSIGQIAHISEDSDLPHEFKGTWLWLKGGLDDTDDMHDG